MDNILGLRYWSNIVHCQVLAVVTLHQWGVTTDPYPHIPPYMPPLFAINTQKYFFVMTIVFVLHHSEVVGDSKQYFSNICISYLVEYIYCREEGCIAEKLSYIPVGGHG